MATTLFPDATNTGVPAGVTLTPSGSLVITQAGAVISGLDIQGIVSIEAPNVTLENCRITSGNWGVVIIADGVTGTVVQNCEINGLGTTGGDATGISGQGTFLNNNIYNVENGFSIAGSNVTIQGNYVHDMHASGSPHYDAIQIDGNASNITITGNSLINNNGQTSAIMIDNGFGPISNVQVSNNLLVGGAYTVYSDGRASSSPITGVSFTNNHIGSGQFGYTSFDNNTVTYTGNVNDGAALAASLNTTANQTTGTGSTTGSGSGSSPPPPQTGDIVAPDAPVITKDTVVNNTVQVSGTAEANSTIKLFDGSTLVGTAHAASNGAWSLTTSALTQGTHMLAASATDAAGNTSGLSQAVDPVVGSSSGQQPSPPPADTVAPNAPVITGDTVLHHTVQVSGTAEAGSTIKLYDGSTLLGTTHTAANGDWSLATPALSQGAHELVATATDAAGNTSHLSDAVDPVIGAHSSNGGSTSTHNHLTGSSETLLQFTNVQQNHNTVTLTGTADSGSELSVYDGTRAVGSVTTDTDGNWKFTTSVAPNHVHSFTAALVDSTGDAVATTTGAAIIGTNSAEKLLSTSGDDILTGKGGTDTFVFAPNFGHDTITNFTAHGAGHDTIDFSKSVFDNFASVLAHASQDGQDVVISAGSDTLTLKNTKLSALNSHDFHFG